MPVVRALRLSFPLLAFFFLRAASLGALQDYNVVWETTSSNASESMPCGGGDIGTNVWVEKGDVLIYLSRSGTFDELNGMPKLGRLRLTLSPNPFAEKPRSFRQELNLSKGSVELHAVCRDGNEVDVVVWVDVNLPVVHVDLTTSHETTATMAYESWRTALHRQSTSDEMGANRSYIEAPEPAIVRPDKVEFLGNQIRFMHRNEGRTAFDLVVDQQGLSSVRNKLWNPLAELTFGGALFGEDVIPAGESDGQYASTPFHAWRLNSRAPTHRHHFAAALHLENTASVEQWENDLNKIITQACGEESQARVRTETWWAHFWDRSHVFIQPDAPSRASKPWQVGRNYQVFRYQLGCNARGEYPTKFNGGLFTFDPEFVSNKFKFSPDFRRWGGGAFTAQNQRLVYWPMLKSGDFDMMRAQFEFYRRALVNAETRSRLYWGINGASFSEQIENFGLPIAFEYKWKRGPNAEIGIEDNPWINHQWDTVLEFCQMILDRRAYAGTSVKEYLPLIESCLRFFDEYYQGLERGRSGQPFGSDGKLVIYPGTALETYKDARNPTPTVEALRSVTQSLLELPTEEVSANSHEHWKTFLAHLPEIGFREREGKRVIAPAWDWARMQNSETPQLYPVYPWPHYGVGRADLQLAIDTWRHGLDSPEQRGIQSWRQDPIFCARLGLTEEAAELTLEKMADSDRKFPTWWGPGYDWVPDHNWGGSGMIAVQEMLLQVVGQKIYILPSWPRTWDVDFKLHAPGQTTVEVVLKKGKITKLQVLPEARMADIVLPADLSERNP